MEAHSEDIVLERQQPRNLRLALVNKNDLPHVWESIEPLLAAACERSAGHLDIPTLIDGILNGNYWLFVLADEYRPAFAMVAEVRPLRNGELVFQSVAASGDDLNEWMKHVETMKDFARSLGCTRSRIIGRLGWKKKLPDWTLLGQYAVLEMVL